MANRKIINDPVYGFITIDHPLIFDIISHPYYQRLRNIHQMAFAYLVYPGAVHSRLLHSLGAYHLMCNALHELKSKGIFISEEEELGAKIAILLHDIGHGPFSHTLESVLIQDIHHEKLSILFMEDLNRQMDGKLSLALAIFKNQYPKKFLHQLVSGQLDVDRMDYLTRDSFFTGVAEGVVGYDRIIKMLNVHEGNLVVEEKAIYSIEKFLLSRRLMYWQVYLHKTVVAAEMMLIKIIQRAKYLISVGVEVPFATDDFSVLLHLSKFDEMQHLQVFSRLDDHDILATIKKWMNHQDAVLSLLSIHLVERKIFKIKLQASGFNENEILHQKNILKEKLSLNDEEIDYLVFSGEATNTLYKFDDDSINILYKDGSLKDISQVDHALIDVKTSAPVKKYYICTIRL